MDAARTDGSAAFAGAKRKQRASSCALDATDAQSEECALLSPLKLSMSGSTASRRLSGASPSEAASLVIPRSPSDNSRLWAARIAATQRLARRKSGGGVAPRPAGSKKQALTVDATPSFAESVLTTKTTTKIPAKKSARRKVEPEDDDDDEEMRDGEVAEHAEKHESQSSDDDRDAHDDPGVSDESPVQPVRRSRRTSGRLEQSAKIKEEPAAGINESPARPQSLVKEEQQSPEAGEEEDVEEAVVKHERRAVSRKRAVSLNAQTSVPKTAKTERKTSERRGRRASVEAEKLEVQANGEGEVVHDHTPSHTSELDSGDIMKDEASVKVPLRTRRRSSRLSDIKKEEPTFGIKQSVSPRSLFREESVVLVKHEPNTDDQGTKEHAGKDAMVKHEHIESELEELRRGMASLAASLEAERAEKAELKDQVESLSHMLLASQEKQTRLETKVAELTASLRSGDKGDSEK